MKTQLSFGTTRSIVIAIAALSWQTAAWAQVPTGSLQYSFSVQDGIPLWNFSGTYSTPYYAATNDTLVLHHFGNGNISASYQEDLDIAATENKLTGIALIRFTNGEVFQFQLAGTYFPSTQKTRMLLMGQGEDKGASLVLSFVGPEMNLQRMSGNVGGQRIRYPAL